MADGLFTDLRERVCGLDLDRGAGLRAVEGEPTCTLELTDGTKLKMFHSWPVKVPPLGVITGVATCWEAIGLTVLDRPWPWVEIVTSHAAARGEVVRAMVAAGVQGIVLAGTGNGSVHHTLEAALIEAQHAGVAVLRSTRCLDGPVQMKPGDELPSAGTLTPVQARIELMLQLMRA